MFTMYVPKYLWGQAILTTSYFINCLPSKVLNFKTPMFMFILIQSYHCFDSPWCHLESVVVQHLFIYIPKTVQNLIQNPSSVLLIYGIIILKFDTQQSQ